MTGHAQAWSQRATRLAGAALALVVAGCDDPAWRDPATAHGSAAPPASIAKILASAAARRHLSLAHANHQTTDPRPPAPAWAAGLIGKPLAALFPARTDCMGNTDGVKLRYVGAAPGARVSGWGWDPRRSAPVGRVLLTDAAGVIVGAGESGSRRLDVPRAVPAITSDRTGWEAITSQSAGPVIAYGVLADGKSICPLGRYDL